MPNEIEVIAVNQKSYDWDIIVKIDRNTMARIMQTHQDSTAPHAGKRFDIGPFLDRQDALHRREREVVEFVEALQKFMPKPPAPVCERTPEEESHG